MPGEISAIHRRNISGFQRLKIACVVPIEEMSAEHLHLAHRRQCRFQAFDRFQRAKPSEVSSTNRG